MIGFLSALFQAHFRRLPFFFTVLPIFALAAVTAKHDGSVSHGMCLCVPDRRFDVTCMSLRRGASHNTVGRRGVERASGWIERLSAGFGGDCKLR